MKNKLTHLNNHLFSELERLSEEDLSGDKLTEEIRRAGAIAEVAHAIIDNATLTLSAMKALGDRHIAKLPSMIECETNELPS
jgi:hypothetical protein